MVFAKQHDALQRTLLRLPVESEPTCNCIQTLFQACINTLIIVKDLLGPH